MTHSTPTDHAEDNARGWLGTIRDLIARQRAAHESDDDADCAVCAEIRESVLSVCVSYGDFVPVGDPPPTEPTHYELLLSTGGPAARIVGDLDGGEPRTARLEKQDWFTPWTPVQLADDEHADLDAFARTFCFL